MPIDNCNETSKRIQQTLYENMFEGYNSVKGMYLINCGMIKNLYYELENVKGIDYTKEKSNFNKDRKIDRYYQISDQIEQYEKENCIIKEYLDMMERISEKIQDETIKKFIVENYISTHADLMKQIG